MLVSEDRGPAFPRLRVGLQCLSAVERMEKQVTNSG